MSNITHTTWRSAHLRERLEELIRQKIFTYPLVDEINDDDMVEAKRD